MMKEQLTAKHAQSAKEAAAESAFRVFRVFRGSLLPCSTRCPPSCFATVLVALLFFGAMFWAKGRDPFERVWFKVRVPGQGNVGCIAVLPKTSLKSKVQRLKSGSGRLPVVVYLHGSGGSLLGDGNELRQMAEMGLAVVGMEPKAESGKQKAEMGWAGTGEAGEGTEDGFDGQFGALLDYLGRQRWADTNRVAWVGFSLGAQRALAFALRHPETRPRLLVRLAGGWVPELERFKVQGSGFKGQGSQGRPCTFLLLHGEHDEVFPLSQARQVAACLETNGVPVELKVLPGEGHDLGANRLLVFRVIGEQCLTRLAGPDALANYRSILSWQAQARPLWLFWTPALMWVGIWLWLRRGVTYPDPWKRGEPAPCPAPAPKGTLSPSDGERDRERGLGSTACAAPIQPRGAGVLRLRWGVVALRGLAAVLATAAVAQTALHLVPPRLATSECTLSIARKHLVQAKELGDFDFLAANPIWRGKPLKTLLEHVELAHYNHELVNWKLDDQLYREYVLSAQIDPTADGELNWRRPLWENFYPRIRREQDPAAAAEIVVRFLRERVTIASGSALPSAVAEIWQRQITDQRGFEAVYVAALRSVGVPSRLGAGGRAEFWTGSAWQPAPRPLVGESWGTHRTPETPRG
jgi:predicted esterase